VQIVEAEAKKGTVEETIDWLLIPALNFAKRDRMNGEINDDDEKFILRAIREIVDDLTEVSVTASTGAEEAGPRVHVLGCPSLDEFDRLALEMLRKVLRDERWNFEVVTSDLLTAEVLQHVSETRPGLVCIGSLPPGSAAHARYLCKRLRSRLPEARIVVGRWGEKVDAAMETQLKEAGADQVESNILATRHAMRALWPVLAQELTKKNPASPEDDENVLESEAVAV